MAQDDPSRKQEGGRKQEGDRRQADEPRRRRRSSDRVGLLMAALLDPAARRRGFATASLLTDWATIVGERLAGRCRPVAVRHQPRGRGGATLELAATGGAALELQHGAPQLIQRVNGFFGGPVVARIVIRQWPRPPAPPPPPAPIPLGEEEAAAVRAAAGLVQDEGLRDALCRLGLRVAAAGRRGV